MKVTSLDHVRLNLHKIKVERDGVEITEDIYKGDTFTLICCDCGLTHRVGIMQNMTTGETTLLFERDNRATGQYRRQTRVLLHKGIGKWKLVRRD